MYSVARPSKMGFSNWLRLAELGRIVSRLHKETLQRFNGRREEVLSTSMDHPAIKIQSSFGRVFAIWETNGARWVVREPLTHNGINTRTMFANKLGLAVGEMMVARPALKRK